MRAVEQIVSVRPILLLAGYCAASPFRRMRKVLILSLQNRPTLVGVANQAEATVAAAAVRVAAAPVSNPRVVGAEIPTTAT